MSRLDSLADYFSQQWRTKHDIEIELYNGGDSEALVHLDDFLRELSEELLPEGHLFMPSKLKSLRYGEGLVLDASIVLRTDSADSDDRYDLPDEFRGKVQHYMLENPWVAEVILPKPVIRMGLNLNLREPHKPYEWE